MTRIVTGISGIIIAMIVVFILTDAPAWSYAFPAVLLAAEVTMIIRSNRIQAGK